MNQNIEDRLRVALAAKANTVTEWDLQPPLVPQSSTVPELSRRIRRMLLWSAPVFAAAAMSGLAFAGVLSPTQPHAAPSVPAVSPPATLPGPSGPAPSPGTTPPGNATTTPTTTSHSAAVLPALPVGGPVPADFQPASVTFVSPTFGYVLGEPPSCASPPCTSLVRTTDRGAHWVGVPAPRAPLGSPSTMTLAGPTPVSVVRFADPYNGWAYGPALWVTHDGARTWHQLDVGGQVMALEAGGGRVDAIVADCEGSASCGGRPTRLLSSPVNSDDFTQVAAESTGLSAPGGSWGGASLTLHPPVGFALLGATTKTAPPAAVIVATADGRSWQSFPDPCRAAGSSSLSSFVAPDTTSLLSLCIGSGAAGSSEKTVVFTRNGKSTVLGSLPLGGVGGQIAANGISTILVASRSGADFLYRSTDSGRTWTTMRFPDGGIGLTDLGFTTASQAVVVHGQPPVAGLNNPPEELLLTTDAGATWHEIVF